jgi:hypothetical protein
LPSSRSDLGAGEDATSFDVRFNIFNNRKDYPMQFPMQTRKPETPAERNVRIATEQGALHAAAVVEILKPFDEQTAAGPMPFAMVSGEIVPLAKAITKLRDQAPHLAALFDANGKLDYGKLSHPEYLAIRTHSPALVHLGPIGKRR